MSIIALYGVLSLLSNGWYSSHDLVRSEFICWSIILFSTKPYLWYHREEGRVGLENHFHITCLAIVGAIVCHSFADVAWIVVSIRSNNSRSCTLLTERKPYLTPTLHIVLRDKPHNGFQQLVEEKALESGQAIPKNGRKHIVVYFSIAVITSLLLWNRVSILSGTTACIFLAASTAIMIKLNDAQIEQSSTKLVASLDQVGTRIWPALALIYLYDREKDAALPISAWAGFCALAGLKSAIWFLYFNLVGPLHLAHSLTDLKV